MTNSKVKLFSCSSTAKFANNADDTANVYNDCPTIHTLLQRAQKVRQRIDDTTCIHDSSKLSYPSSAYNMKVVMEGSSKKTVQRGFCSWLIPQSIMIGQYPGMTPESYGPSSKESNKMLQMQTYHYSVVYKQRYLHKMMILHGMRTEEKYTWNQSI